MTRAPRASQTRDTTRVMNEYGWLAGWTGRQGEERTFGELDGGDTYTACGCCN